MTRPPCPWYFAVLTLLIVGCSPVTLEYVDFSWPVESALVVAKDNRVSESRYGTSFSVAPLAQAEFEDSTALQGTTLRVLRSTAGYYFVTGARFKHVYVMTPGDRELRARSVIEVSQGGLIGPALNQRPPYVELVDTDGTKRILSYDGIVEARK